MSSFTLRTLVEATDSTLSDRITAIREEVDTTYTEKSDNTFIVAGATTDFAVPFGGTSNADLLWVESLTANEVWSFKINGTGNTPITVTGKGHVILSKATVTSLHITVAGANSVTFRVVVFD